MDIVPRLLDVVLNPIKQQFTQRQCAPAHDHGEIQKQERLAEFCCKLIARIIAEMSFSALQYTKVSINHWGIKKKNILLLAVKMLRGTFTIIVKAKLSFSYGALLWNKLPKDIRLNPSIPSFKKK